MLSWLGCGDGRAVKKEGTRAGRCLCALPETWRWKTKSGKKVREENQGVGSHRGLWGDLGVEGEKLFIEEAFGEGEEA